MSQFVYALALGGLGIELDGNRSAEKDGGVGFGQARPQMLQTIVFFFSK